MLYPTICDFQKLHFAIICFRSFKIWKSILAHPSYVFGRILKNCLLWNQIDSWIPQKRVRNLNFRKPPPFPSRSKRKITQTDGFRAANTSRASFNSGNKLNKSYRSLIWKLSDRSIPSIKVKDFKSDNVTSGAL